MLNVLKNLLLALLGGVVAAAGLTWYLNSQDPWQIGARSVDPVELATALPERDEWVQRALDSLGPQRIQAWLELALGGMLGSRDPVVESVASPPEESAVRSEK
jgi:hypothetical protein